MIRGSSVALWSYMLAETYPVVISGTLNCHYSVILEQHCDGLTLRRLKTVLKVIPPVLKSSGWLQLSGPRPGSDTEICIVGDKHADSAPTASTVGPLAGSQSLAEAHQ